VEATLNRKKDSAESDSVRSYASLSRVAKGASLVLAAFVVIGAAALGVRRWRAERAGARPTASVVGAELKADEMATACIDRYNAMVLQAKSDLIKGDRVGAINSLTAAKAQLHQCEALLGMSSSGVQH
jgi:hypothetical protein